MTQAPPPVDDEEGGAQRDPDLVLVILRRVVELCPDIDPEAILAIEAEVRLEHGGRRHFVPKKKKHLNPAQRRALVRDALTNAPTPDIAQRHGVERSTIYRSLKRFARDGG